MKTNVRGLCRRPDPKAYLDTEFSKISLGFHSLVANDGRTMEALTTKKGRTKSAFILCRFPVSKHYKSMAFNIIGWKTCPDFILP